MNAVIYGTCTLLLKRAEVPVPPHLNAVIYGTCTVPYYLKVSYVGTGTELMSEQLGNDAVDSLVGFGLNLLGFDPLVESFEANHRHWDQILQ